MSYRLLRGPLARIGIAVLAFVSCGAARPAAAQTFTLSGTVTGGGSPINGATVEALANGTTSVAGSSTTNSQGQYSISLAPAIYDLRVTPPSGSGFNQELLQDVDLTAGNQQLDVILISSGGGGGGGGTPHTVSGTVRGRDGTPLQGVQVNLYGGDYKQTQTDASGAYTFTTTATSVQLEMYPATTNAAAPDSWYLWRSSITVGAGVVFDVNLSVATVSGSVTDVGGNPAAGASVYASTYISIPGGYLTGGGGITASAAGAYSLRVLTGSVSFTAQGAPGSSFGIATASAEVTGDTTRNFVLPSTIAVTGTLRGLGGQPVAGAQVYASAGGLGGTVTTGADGRFAFNLSPGSLNLYLWGNDATGVAPSYYEWYNQIVNVAGSTTIDIDLPVVTVSGTVKNSANVPMSGAFISGSTFGSDVSARSMYSGGSTTSGSNGTYSMLLFRGTANFSVSPPSGSTAAGLDDRNVALTASAVRDFVLPERVTLGGTVRGIGGQPLPGVRVQISSTGAFTSVLTDANGAYAALVSPGSVGLTFTPDAPSAAAPTYWYASRNVSVGGTAATFDLTLNVIRLNGRAQDSNGAPVGDVNVSAYSYGYTGGYTETYVNATTDASGSFSMLLLAGDYGGVSIQPPVASGFSSVGVNRTFTANLSQRIVLQRPDTTPPVIVSGPAVLHLSSTSVSIGWTTNEPATSIVDYGIGDFTLQAGSSALVTSHTVTLLGLTPNQIYSFRASSSDRNGNGPTQSATGTFTMLAPPGDLTAPQILAGPLAAFVSDSAALVQWLTNEPATSVVRWGTVPDSLTSATALVPGEFVGVHARLLSGLAPNTDYFARVESADPDGNTIESSVFSFRTAAAPDIQAPVITAGPTVVSVTHNSATIRWTTDEAATSGISYNDGSAFNLTSSDSLTTVHELVLAGLSPGRSYSFSVASRDAVGNGPTLSGSSGFTTLGAPDVTPPAFASALAIGPLSKTTAAFQWNTDEPATKVIRFGTVSGALDQVVSDLSLQTSHHVALTGLLPGTTYYITRQVTDASGNTATSAEDNFQTVPDTVNTPPTPPSPVTASPNPTRTGSFTITWGASTDDGPGGVKEYAVVNGGVVVQTLPPTATSFGVSGLPEGSHTYWIRAVDFSGASSESELVVVVVDMVPPLLTLPSPITTPATTNTDAIVTYAVTAHDNKDRNPVVTCTPASGSAFPIGTTTVPCTARDAAGNVTSDSFTVTVTDPFAPILTVPADITVQAENQNGIAVTFSASAIDNHDPNPVVSCTPPSGSVFPVGVTPVICTATDASGNVATRSFNVAVGAPPKVASSIAVASSVPAPTFGQSIVLTATVSGTAGSTPTGTVTFYVDGVQVGQAPLGTGSPITASLTIATLHAGARSITATYIGDFGHEPSTSTALALQIAKAQPAVSAVGGSVPYNGAPQSATGTVTGVGGVPIGTPVFTYNGSPDAPSAVGSYAVVASFAGNDDYEAGSANTTLTIDPGPTATAVQPGPSTVFGQAATISAYVDSPTGEVPQGSVEFFDGAASLGTAALNGDGVASVSLSSLAVGRHTLTAVYSGGGNFAGSTSGGAVLIVHLATTATALSVVPNPAGYLEGFRVTATVAVMPPGAGAPDGVVEFFAGTTPMGTAPLTLVGGVPTAVTLMNGLPAGRYDITARYAGSTTLASSKSPVVSQEVRSADSSTWTYLVISPASSSRAGTNVTLTAVVVPLAGTVQPTGSVQFLVWGTPLGSPVPLANVSGTMVATLTTSALPSGVLQVRARYVGSAGFAPSVSAPASHTIYTTTAPAATTTSMTLSGATITLGSSLTATVSVAAGGRPISGYLLLFVDGTPVQAVAVASSSPAAFTVTGLGRGLHGITAQFVPTGTALAGSLSHAYVFVQ